MIHGFIKTAVASLPLRVADCDYNAAACETAIARLEADMTRLDGEMAQHACDAEKLNELYRQQQDVQKQLEQEMERWEQLSLQAEEQENEA